MVALSCSVDITGLSLGVGMAEQYSRRTLPQICNTSAYWIAVNTKNAMPFVTPGKVDEELATLALPVMGARGKPLKNKKRYSAGFSSIQRSKAKPLALLIVLARHSAGSRYNVLTHGRYALPPVPKGIPPDMFANVVSQEIHEMIAKRHSSGKFLLAGFIQPLQTLRPYAVQKFMRGVRTGGDAGAFHTSATLGAANPARPGLDVMAVVVNGVGMKGVNKDSFNAALNRYGLPILQAKTNAEGIRNMEFAAREMEKELAAGFNRFTATP